jgi:hypothetical protein
VLDYAELNRDGAYVRRLLEDAISDSATPRPHFEFNRFEITIEREASIVVLDSTRAGVRHVPLAEFTAALRQSRHDLRPLPNLRSRDRPAVWRR